MAGRAELGEKSTRMKYAACRLAVVPELFLSSASPAHRAIRLVEYSAHISADRPLLAWTCPWRGDIACI